MISLIKKALCVCGVLLAAATVAAEVLVLPSGSVKNIEYTNSKAPAYLAFDAVINTNFSKSTIYTGINTGTNGFLMR